MTVHDGELVWSCRLDELLQYGCFLNAVPKTAPKRERLEQIRAGGNGRGARTS
jgi:hypothetical protein